jgi:hypothetical protein
MPVNTTELLKGLDEGLQDAARAVLELAQRNAPVGTPPDDAHPGMLRDSGHLEHHEHPSGDVWVVVFDVPYAASQHEALDQRHTQGGPKYLENALKAIMPTVEAAVAGKVFTHQRGGVFQGGDRV